MRRCLLQLVHDAADDAQLCDEVNRLFVVAEETARDVTILDDKDILLDASHETRTQQILEEGHVLTKLTDLRKFVLEERPDIVRLPIVSLLWREKDLVSELLIELFLVLRKFAKLCALNIAVNDTLMLRINLEKALMLRPVDLIIVGQLNIGIDRVRRRCENMMEAALWHDIQGAVEFRCLQHRLVFEEVVDRRIIGMVICDLLAPNHQLVISATLVVGQGCLKAIAEVLFLVCLDQGFATLEMRFNGFIDGGLCSGLIRLVFGV